MCPLEVGYLETARSNAWYARSVDPSPNDIPSIKAK
jgi:hypothetical protein